MPDYGSAGMPVTEAPRQPLFSELHELFSRVEGLINYVESTVFNVVGSVPMPAQAEKAIDQSNPTEAIYIRIKNLHYHIDNARQSLDRLQSTLI